MPDSGPSKHILVVDDTEDILELFRDIIEDLGHRVTATTFAPEDLAQVISISPDLAILDIQMGGDSAPGWALLQKMKMSRETDAIPIIVCSVATTEVKEQESWLISKGIRIVRKPFSVDELELAIAQAFELPRLVPGADGTTRAFGGAVPH